MKLNRPLYAARIRHRISASDISGKYDPFTVLYEANLRVNIKKIPVYRINIRKSKTFYIIYELNITLVETKKRIKIKFCYI